jgi:hypothetical protein
MFMHEGLCGAPVKTHHRSGTALNAPPGRCHVRDRRSTRNAIKPSRGGRGMQLPMSTRLMDTDMPQQQSDMTAIWRNYGAGWKL